MRRIIALGWASVVSLAALATECATPNHIASGVIERSPAVQTEDVVEATTAFLNSLDADRRQKVLFAFNSGDTATSAKFPGGINGRITFVGEQYGAAVWSNYPVSDVPRPGLALGTMSDTQRAAAMHLLEVLLSAKGYQKVLDIMGSDQALSEGGTQFKSGAAYYTLGIFGTPTIMARPAPHRSRAEASRTFIAQTAHLCSWPHH